MRGVLLQVVEAHLISLQVHLERSRTVFLGLGRAETRGSRVERLFFCGSWA